MEGDRQGTGKQVDLTGTQVVVGAQGENCGGREEGGVGPSHSCVHGFHLL